MDDFVTSTPYFIHTLTHQAKHQFWNGYLAVGFPYFHPLLQHTDFYVIIHEWVPIWLQMQVLDRSLKHHVSFMLSQAMTISEQARMGVEHMVSTLDDTFLHCLLHSTEFNLESDCTVHPSAVLLLASHSLKDYSRHLHTYIYQKIGLHVNLPPNIWRLAQSCLLFLLSQFETCDPSSTNYVYDCFDRLGNCTPLILSFSHLDKNTSQFSQVVKSRITQLGIMENRLLLNKWSHWLIHVDLPRDEWMEAVECSVPFLNTQKLWQQSRILPTHKQDFMRQCIEEYDAVVYLKQHD